MSNGNSYEHRGSDITRAKNTKGDKKSMRALLEVRVRLVAVLRRYGCPA